MMEFLKSLFSSEGFMPHGHCLLWKPSAVWLHVISDSSITLAYYSIPITLLYFVRKRRDLAFQWVFLMFGAFIFGCGTTHLMEIWTLWVPTYWLDGIVKALTALLSLATAVAIVLLVPQVLSLRSPAELEAANRELEKQIAERKRVEETLYESERRYRLLAENSTDVIWTTDMDLRFTYLSPSVIRQRGYSVEEAMAQTFDEVLTPSSFKVAMDAFMEELAIERTEQKGLFRSRTLELELTHKDGSTVWTESKVTFLRDRDSCPVGILGVTRDITERKRAEEILRKSEERYRDLVENSEDLICTHDLEGNILSANRALVRRLGYERTEEIIGRNISDFLAPEVRHLFNSYIDALVREGHAHGLMKILTRSGEEKVLEYRNSLRTEGIDKPIVRGMAHDVTERNRAEEALQESNQFNEAIISGASEGIIVYDHALRYVMWNRFMEELTSLPVDQVLGKYALDLFPHLYEQGIYSMLQMALKGETVSSPDIPYYVPQTGKSGWVSGSYGPHRNTNGEIIGVIGLVRDITERKYVEETLESSFSLLRATLESTTDGILVVNKEGKITIFNRKFVEMWQIPESITESKDDSQALAFVLDQLKNPKDFLVKVRELYSQPDAESYDILEFKDGRIFERYSQPQRIAETVVGRVWSFRDVTEHKRAEESLRENLAQLSKKNRYETIISTVTQSVHKSINLQDVLENAVEAMNKNIDQADIIGIYLAEGEEAVLKAHRGFPNQYIERAARILHPKGLTWKTIIDGKPRYCADVDRDEFIGLAGRELGMKSYLSMPIRFEGKTIGCINIGSLKKDSFDEEELRLLEIVAQQIEVALDNAQIAEVLRQSEERYRTLFDQSPVGVYIYDKKFRIVQCNERMAQILQSSCDRIVGLDMRSLNDRGFIPVMERTLGGEFCREERFYEATSSGAKLWLSLSLSPLRDAHGEVIAGMAVVEDITERKQAEEQIKASLEEKEVLLREIHHRVKNNLQVISSLLDLQSRYISDEQSNNIFKESQSRIKSMAFVHEKLYQSKDLARINLAEYIRDLATNLFHSYGVSSTAIKLKITADDTLLDINTAVPLGLIINELVSNSLKHGFPKGGEGKINIELRSDNNGKFTLTVSDNGVGFSKDLDFQNTNSLGLRLVRTLTNQLKGNIEIRSNGGTEFKIIFEELKYRGRG